MSLWRFCNNITSHFHQLNHLHTDRQTDLDHRVGINPTSKDDWSSSKAPNMSLYLCQILIEELLVWVLIKRVHNLHRLNSYSLSRSYCHGMVVPRPAPSAHRKKGEDMCFQELHLAQSRKKQYVVSWIQWASWWRRESTIYFHSYLWVVSITPSLPSHERMNDQYHVYE